MHSDQFKPKPYLKLILKKYIFSEGEQFPLIGKQDEYTLLKPLTYIETKILKSVRENIFSLTGRLAPLSPILLHQHKS